MTQLHLLRESKYLESILKNASEDFINKKLTGFLKADINTRRQVRKAIADSNSFGCKLKEFFGAKYITRNRNLLVEIESYYKKREAKLQEYQKKVENELNKWKRFCDEKMKGKAILFTSNDLIGYDIEPNRINELMYVFFKTKFSLNPGGNYDFELANWSIYFSLSGNKTENEELAKKVNRYWKYCCDKGLDPLTQDVYKLDANDKAEIISQIQMTGIIMERNQNVLRENFENIVKLYSR